MYTKDDFCKFCGAGIPPKDGEGTCHKCNPLQIMSLSMYKRLKEQGAFKRNT